MRRLTAALEEFRQGRFLVLVDAPDREDEMAKGRQLEEFAARFGCRLVDVEQITEAALGGARR